MMITCEFVVTGVVDIELAGQPPKASGHWRSPRRPSAMMRRRRRTSCSAPAAAACDGRTRGQRRRCWTCALRAICYGADLRLGGCAAPQSLGNGPQAFPGGAQKSNLLSFFVWQMRIRGKSNTPSYGRSSIHADTTSARGCCTSRRNSPIRPTTNKFASMVRPWRKMFGKCWNQKARNSLKLRAFLVAGAGFEPATFRL